MSRPEALSGLVLFGLARLENRPTCRTWAVRQARWPVEAWHGSVARRPYELVLYRAVPSTGPCWVGPGQPVAHLS